MIDLLIFSTRMLNFVQYQMLTMKKQTLIFFYAILIYITLQFLWWGYHLIDITEKLHFYDHTYKSVNTKILMIVGEGMVFLILLLLSFWRIYKSIKKDKKLTEQQNNFLLSVTHELKTPIASTQLYLQTLLKRDFDEKQRTELLTKALHENKYLQQIVESILTATRIEGRSYIVHREKIDIRYVIAEIVDKMNQQKEFNWIQFETNTIDPLLLHGDLFMIQTIMNNLLQNAIKYCAEDTPILAYALKEENKIRIGVKDLGKGIALENREDLFKKFVRGENEETRSKKGTGLGLFIASEFSKLNNGILTYTDNIPNGSIFDVSFNID